LSKKKRTISSVNQDYKLSSSYPQFLVTPNTIPDGSLRKISKFRTRGRIPVVTWKNPKEPQVLLRSSQPQIGLINSRCLEDEVFFF